MTIRKGDRFFSAHQHDVNWRPAPGQRYADAPRALMVVTRVARDVVYYRTEYGAGRWHARKEDMTAGGAVVATWWEGEGP